MNKEEKITISVNQEEIQQIINSYEKDIEYIKKLEQENKQLKDNWNKLKEIIDVKLYNMDYLVKLCGYKIDSDTRMILDIIKKEMQKLEKGEEYE